MTGESAGRAGDIERVYTVLFLWTGNSARSIPAETILDRMPLEHLALQRRLDDIGRGLPVTA